MKDVYKFYEQSNMQNEIAYRQTMARFGNPQEDYWSRKYRTLAPNSYLDNPLYNTFLGYTPEQKNALRIISGTVPHRLDFKR